MTVETETILIKLLEDLKTEFKDLKTEFKDLKTEFKDLKTDLKETNQKLDKFIETTNQKFENQQKDLADIKITQGIQGEQIKGLKEDFSEVRSEIKGRISSQGYWFLSLLSVLVLLLSKVVFFPNP